MSTIRSMWTSILFAIAASNSISQPSFANAQQVCSCSPTVYKWKLDFANSCNYVPPGAVDPDDIGIDIGPDLGVIAATCEVKMLNPTSPMDTSLIPVSVTRFQFVELDSNFEQIKVVGSGPDFIPLGDGGVLEYTSETAAGTQIPIAILATIFADNAQGTEIQLEWFVRFSNECETIPFQDGDSIGWTVFSFDAIDGTIPARDSTCQFASQSPSVKETPFPVASPSKSPTTSPSVKPSMQPSISPTISSSLRPSALPTAMPSLRPSASPTATPSMRPSASPTATPSTNPTVFPTRAGSSSPSVAPSTSFPTKSPTMTPSVVPSTSSPTESPTKIPSSGPTSDRPDRPPTKSPVLAPNSGGAPSPAPSPHEWSKGSNPMKKSKSKRSKSEKSSKSKSAKGSKSEKSSKSKSAKSEKSWSYKGSKSSSKSSKNKTALILDHMMILREP